MRKKLFALLMLIPLALFTLAACGTDEYILNENTFFWTMTHMQMYPGNYVGKNIEADLFMYTITDVNDVEYNCAVRKCSSGYGCTCGNDTIIGFVLEYDGELPEPVNQSEDTNDKTWVHIKGQLESKDFLSITIHSYDSEGNVVEGVNETLSILVFCAETVTVIGDYSGLNYYVTN